MDKAVKQEIIKKYARKEGDTGSPEVQIALLSNRISDCCDGHTQQTLLLTDKGMIMDRITLCRESAGRFFLIGSRKLPAEPHPDEFILSCRFDIPSEHARRLERPEG